LLVLRVTPIALICLAVVSAASADTIVLKNGRRIIASNVTESGGRVTYDTPAGQLTIPRAIVERIEKNDFVPTEASHATPAVSVPSVDLSGSYADVASQAVHDGSIDISRIAQWENDARGNDPGAIGRVIAAHHAAAQFLIGKGDLDGAAEHYSRAAILAPNNVPVLLNLAVLDLRRSQYKAAMEPLERARRLEPNSADVAKLMGWAYYGANNIDRAVAEWKRALALHPDAEVQSALDKAERDQQEEASYREGETAHFTVKYSGAADPDLAREILRTLEEHFRDIEGQLDYTPPESIGVILYTQQAFADITRAPGWAGAINDGRIRVPTQGLTSMTSELSRVLKHELTHSFVGQKTRGRCPTWLQEGLAQWMEGRRSGESAGILLQVYDHNMAPSLASMEGSWMSMSGDSASYAYAWALAAVEAIINSGGMSDIERLLDKIGADPSVADALRDSLRTSYADLSQQTATYLRRQYTR
jgi:tetratricopeptide (TPR) repeat protein